jgi:hypothetical protein
VHCPATHFCDAESQFASVVHVFPLGLGLQAPLSHVKPVAHGVVALHSARHWPFAQIFPAPHSLENLHTLVDATHRFCWHSSPAEQSFAVLHGHGPLVPPHAWHLLATHVLPAPQSAREVHSRAAGGLLAGAVHRLDLHTSPFWQSPSVEHVVVQP